MSDDEWAFVVPYLILLPEDAGQHTYSPREMFNGLRWIARAGAPRHMMPNDLPPWWVVYQQTQRWLAAGCFSALVDDLRLLLREARCGFVLLPRRRVVERSFAWTTRF